MSDFCSSEIDELLNWCIRSSLEEDNGDKEKGLTLSISDNNDATDFFAGGVLGEMGIDALIFEALVESVLRNVFSFELFKVDFFITGSSMIFDEEDASFLLLENCCFKILDCSSKY